MMETKPVSKVRIVISRAYFQYFRDDHQFSPLHWAAKGGHTKIVEMLMSRGARVHTTNMGDDTPLHLAAAFGNRDIVLMVILKSNIMLFKKIYFKYYRYLFNRFILHSNSSF